VGSGDAGVSLRTPLSQARGLGAAKEGTGHWWAQRLTSVFLVPLVLWGAFSVAMLPDLSHAGLVAWLQKPVVSVLLIALLIVVFWHMELGLRIIVEDYVHLAWLKVAAIVLVDFAVLLLAVAAVAAVVGIAFR